MREIRKLSLADRQFLISKLTDGTDNNVSASPASPPFTASVSASPSASLDASPASLPGVVLTNSPPSASGSLLHAGSGQGAHSNEIVAPNAITLNNQTGSVSVGNSTKNFERRKPKSKLRVGDKCKAKRPDRWGVPADKVLTIKHIDRDSEGDLAHVTFDGCRSITGSAVLLSDLYPVEEQANDET